MGEWLESLVPWGLDVILWVQAHSNEGIDVIFKFFTWLGYEEFYLFVLPLIYWCIHKQVGLAIAYLSMVSAWLNNTIKHLFNIPRPIAFDPTIRMPIPDPAPSFPSGHAQNAVANWGYLAYRFPNRIFRFVAILIILAISLSRIVLGAHFPQDIVGGALIGLVLLLAFVWLAPPLGRWVEHQPIVVQVLLAVALPLTLIFLGPGDTEGHYPAKSSIITMSALVGVGLGAIMERAWVRFAVAGKLGQRILRALLGLAIVALLYLGSDLLLPEEMAYGAEATVTFGLYALLGWTIIFFCPWLFVRLGLAKALQEMEQEARSR